MKKLIILVVFNIFTIALWGQHETVFGRAKVVGGFGGPIFEWALGDNLTTSVGGGGGIVIDNFFFGGYGLASIDLEQLFAGDNIDELELAHGGFWLGLTIPTHKVVHIFASTRIGWGAVNIRLHDPFQTFENVDKIFAFTPELGIELNLTRWFRIAGSAGYRWVDGANENRGYTDDDFTNGIATLTLRFGWFGHRRY